MPELLDTMTNAYGELAELVYEHGNYRAYEGFELLHEADDFDSLLAVMRKEGWRWI